ncbi:ubiquinone anaerobic biosynthesis accessory factor UbiT [Ferrimonas balearica]|uniref:ubiquinone anaerobic biosynthesis accessory factor UbiT n=1 Tax=Ferrimonas balearica TaxID=44012 RepID=UPI001F15B4F6|nr:SCP2 sterol-binding domain-containing protein [Ferrimonas balearica]MBY6018127.1 SCP2 sterol-binding domain-containing protein [Halomonas denitrificans]MBY6094466.1 SCP2 sterol-binding domain-containing protein [Ferrimonas balearica]
MLPRPPLGPIRALLLPLLNQRLAAPLRDGELDFLEGRSVSIAVRELPLPIKLGLSDGRLWLDWADASVDARLSGDARALLQMALGSADGDALFFQRRLAMEGDTELAMELKSLLGRYPLLPAPPFSLPGLGTV